MQSFLKLFFQSITFALILSVAIFSSDVFAQSGLRIFDEIGGGGSSSSQSSDSNDDTALYVVGGLLIAGILVYALVIKKDKKADEDTTSSVNSNLKLSEANGFYPAEELQKIKEKIPVDLFLGIRNNEAVMNDKTYLLGFRVKL
ncbi:MAG: hypothetical protein OQJ78_04095 [Ignavibacteriaceae bacterium]|nr:hypothetical protein [Ignavibacteriaceae bacterium]